MSRSQPDRIPDGMHNAPNTVTVDYCARQAARVLLNAETLQDRQHEEALNLAASWMELLDRAAGDNSSSDE